MLAPGANAPLPTTSITLDVRHGGITGADVDVSVFLVGPNGKVRSDADMCFYHQPSAENGALMQQHADASSARFQLDLARLPDSVDKAIITATIHNNTANFGRVASIAISAGGVEGQIPCAGKTESALILAEIYRRQGAWKLRIVGQGFNGGLAPLAQHLGVDIAEDAQPDPQPATPLVPSSSSIRLEKKLIDLQKKDPKMVDLVKKVQVALDKRPLLTDRAKVVLCLDISGSMAPLYKNGAIDTLVQRIMALGYRFDDDGDIDVFLFGEQVHTWGALGVDTYRTFVKDMTRKHRLESSTRYGRAMETIRNWARATNPEGLPIYVMFVTDGGTDDKPKTRKELLEASKEPIFWQFMAIGAKSKFAPARFEFLENLDTLTGRTVDNANAFQVADPAAPSDEEMFELMMAEYPIWLEEAEKAGVLRLP